jgi:beta-glucosidase
MWFQVDMGTAQTFDEITMDSGTNTSDYARGYQVYVSNDGTNFGSAIASGTGTGSVVIAQFPQQTARYIKVVQTGSASNWWSIAEFNAYLQ